MGQVDYYNKGLKMTQNVIYSYSSSYTLKFCFFFVLEVSVSVMPQNVWTSAAIRWLFRLDMTDSIMSAVLFADSYSLITSTYLQCLGVGLNRTALTKWIWSWITKFVSFKWLWAFGSIQTAQSKRLNPNVKNLETFTDNLLSKCLRGGSFVPPYSCGLLF